ncbi:MAG TPA: AAA family ATPase [Leptospiraceae bacterium]|nr:AAA family ATPase [Leptospiraceae bacterium]HNF26471.1 AAA family ATPase [Leptospiraceae bacterium]HNI97867.1 AAA family ATPase [Leptospiraceae bacterium]
MYLKSLNIVGFKTFADETELSFDPGFTAVVGPNGSGKSNIVDAVKWVLGEKSAKGLRGDKMEDVIFHGSESREAGGFAEVSLTLDNSKKIFHIDFPTVKITRRIYPDQSNEYFINNARSLRKDVEKLLMDTGVGKSSYSIMEQGKVDAILNSKPEERRAIFDEAAGISKFKSDRMETEKKLEYTAQNLLRISDIMSSMEKELELKERQAEKAKRYFELKNSLAETDKNLRYLKWRQIRNRQRKTEAELEEVRKKNDEIMNRMSEDSRKLEELEQTRQEAERKISEIDRQLLDFLSQKDILKEKIEKNKSMIAEYVFRMEEQTKNLETDRAKLDRLENEKTALEDSIRSFQETEELTQGNINKQEQRKAALESELAELQNRIQTYELTVREKEKSLVILRENVKEIVVNLIQQIESKKKDAVSGESRRLELKNYLLGFLDDLILASESPDSTELFKNFSFRDYRENLKNFLELEDVFRDIVFDKDGMLARKESLDSEIEELILENEQLLSDIRSLQSESEEKRKNISELKEEVYSLEKQLLESRTGRTSLDAGRAKLMENIAETKERYDSVALSLTSISEKKTAYENEVVQLEEQIERSYNEFLNISKILETEKTDLKNLTSEIQNLKSSTGKDQEEFKSLLPLLSELERKNSSQKTQMEAFQEELYNDYSITDQDLEQEKSGMTLKQDAEESKMREIKSEIQILGSINPLAIEEFRNVKEIYDHHKSQRDDIEKSKADIEKVIREINAESEKLFIETFEIIQGNFQDTFSTLFNGGSARLVLSDRTDPLNSGIEIIAEPPGKHVQNLKLLSGGEKSMTVIALLFAIYMVRPSPFCFLDEIDAALDEVNKIRFCQILDKFKDKSQFVVITHAPPTISRASTIFGVTAEEPGVSKLLSLKLEEAKNFSRKVQKAV